MIALGADHAGFEYKENIKPLLTSLGYEFMDFGTHSTESVDYPDFAHKVASGVSSGKFSTAILVCGTGIGMCIVANKHENVRAAVVESIDAAKYTRLHNNANILCIGSRIIPWERTIEIIKTFLTTEFEGGRHQKRLDKIHTLTSL
ncbi:MAG: ribose 5-phosphate isomerase B [Ignavibacteriae bacterium]|nr:ribose 5-phosphate isomerase B [Ignavibacteriota bacterium]